jgi:hypothetical protein
MADYVIKINGDCIELDGGVKINAEDIMIVFDTRAAYRGNYFFDEFRRFAGIKRPIEPLTE